MTAHSTGAPDDPGMGSDIPQDDPNAFARAGVHDIARSNGDDPDGSSIDRKQLMALMAQAAGACVLSGCQSTLRIGFSWAGYGSAIVRQVGAMVRNPDAGSDALRVMLDDSIAHLREVGELSVQEAGVLQMNLQELSRRLRDLEQGTVSQPNRYAKAKR